MKISRQFFLKLFCRSVSLVFFFCMLWAFLTSMFQKNVLYYSLTDFMPVNKGLLLFFGFLFLIFLYQIYSFFQRKQFDPRTMWILSGVLFFLFLVCQGLTPFCWLMVLGILEQFLMERVIMSIIFKPIFFADILVNFQIIL